MEIRYIRPHEAIDYQKVSAASFIWKLDPKVDDKVEVPVLAAFQDGKLFAGVELFDCKTNFCQNALNSIVVSGVCSLPEHRRLGGIREIFKRIGETAVENDLVLGFLRPFSISCYEKFGYANLNRLFTVRIPFEKLKDIPRNGNVVLYTGEQFDEICSLHNKCAMTENLVTFREDEKHFCNSPLESANYTYFRRNEQGEADGYIRFKVERPDNLFVEELFVLSPEALYGLVGFLRNYDCIVKNLIVRNQYQGSPFNCLADRTDDAVYEHNGGVAARIYDIQKLFESNAYPDEYGRFSVRCIDEFEQNNGIFEVEYKNGTATVIKKNDGDYDISLTAPAAAKLMLAGEGHTAKTALYIDGVDIKGNADDFFRAFPFRHTRFTDSAWSV